MGAAYFCCERNGDVAHSEIQLQKNATGYGYDETLRRSIVRHKKNNHETGHVLTEESVLGSDQDIFMRNYAEVLRSHQRVSDSLLPADEKLRRRLMLEELVENRKTPRIKLFVSGLIT